MGEAGALRRPKAGAGVSVKPLLLDLFCGAGGAANGYQRAGFHVIGVDIYPQPNYCGDVFWQADALEHLAEAIDKFYPFNYVDAIHASPPCQRWSSKTKDKEMHPDFIEPLKELLGILAEEDVPWVIENVPGAPLKNPIQLCGSSFGLGVRRHRLFESNITLYDLPCRHGWQKPRFEVYDHGKHYLSGTVPVFGTGGGKAREHWKEAMDIDWMTDAELAEAIPPAYTHFIGAQLRAHIEHKVWGDEALGGTGLMESHA